MYIDCPGPCIKGDTQKVTWANCLSVVVPVGLPEGLINEFYWSAERPAGQ